MSNAPSDPPMNFGSYSFKEVAPDQLAGQLSAGKYSLSTLSTVPYVSLVGMEGREKVFGWNELIEIPRGRVATVKNASFHAGDIFINGGWDYATIPHRVTIPVPVTSVALEETIQVTAPIVDTRRCKRGWFVLDVTSAGSSNGSSTAYGAGVTHSVPVNAPQVAPNLGAGFGWGLTLLAGQAYTYFPLGFGTSFGQEEPMALLDRGYVELFLASDAAFNDAVAFYVLEY